LADRLKGQVSEGTVYLGYPVLATADVRVVVDALLVSRAHGLVAFLLAGSLPQNDDDWAGYIDAQDRLYAVLESDLRKHDGLRAGRRLALTIQTVTVFPCHRGDNPLTSANALMVTSGNDAATGLLCWGAPGERVEIVCPPTAPAAGT